MCISSFPREDRQKFHARVLVQAGFSRRQRLKLGMVGVELSLDRGEVERFEVK